MLAEEGTSCLHERLAPGRRGGLAKVNISTSLTFKVKDVENREENFLSLGPSSLSQRGLGGMPLTSPFLLNALLSEDTRGEIAMPRWDVEGSEFWGPVA